MQKQAPSIPRILTMVLFALSCFGLLLFLWLSFGGPIPLKPQAYRFKVNLPEATQLGLEADVREAGVTVGHVVKKDLASGKGNATTATVEMEQKYAPVRSDAKVILRQKTLLGETYLELTPGTKQAPYVKDGGFLKPSQVKPSVQLDEIFQAFDPVTRQAWRDWQQDLAPAVNGRGQDLNDSLGNLPAFVTSGDQLMTLLDQENVGLRQLISNTGVVFNALSRNEGQLRNLVTSGESVFSATARQNKALAETFRIFPTFLDESKATMARLRTFALDTDPLIRDLRPVARDLVPTLRATRKLAPDLRRFFVNLNPLIDASKRGLPALRDVLKGLDPLLVQLGPFLEQLNPILRWIEYNQPITSNFISAGITGVADTTTATGGGIGHYLRQFGPTGPDTVALSPTRQSFTRGNSYPYGANLAIPEMGKFLIIPSHDCDNAGGEVPPNDSPVNGNAGCFVEPGAPGQAQGTPNVGSKDDYSK
jgi:phospholipid/cholesterol/gamma-HCH transport system substrate-binding protein